MKNTEDMMRDCLSKIDERRNALKAEMLYLDAERDIIHKAIKAIHRREWRIRKPSVPRVGSVASRIIDVLATAHGPLTVHEIAGALHKSPSSTSVRLSTLKRSGFVIQPPGVRNGWALPDNPQEHASLQ